MNGYEGPHLVDNGDGTVSQRVSLSGSNVIQPVDIQSRYSQTIQTHNAVSVGANNYSVGSWIDTNGFDKIAVSLLNDGAFICSIDVHWSNDGVTQHSWETGASSSGSSKNAIFDTKARYARVKLVNGEAAAHVMSAWVYLKA